MSNPATITAEIRDERARQVAKFGQQDHPNGTGPEIAWAFTGPAAYVADSARGECQRLFAEGHGTWRDVLTEEVAEAYAEDDPPRLRAELIQVAAVAAAWVEGIDRQILAQQHAEGPGVMSAVNPDLPCEHQNFAAVVTVNRIQRSDDDPTVIAYNADITVACESCGEPFRWSGVETGMSPAGPMCSVDGTQLRAPLRPASSDPDFGLGMPGFMVRVRPRDLR